MKIKLILSLSLLQRKVRLHISTQGKKKKKKVLSHYPLLSNLINKAPRVELVGGGGVEFMPMKTDMARYIFM